ncbi:GNAT family N-acetyltransferase [Desulfosarcina cetonica]|uniref:GNAT family N-acetyltransferase n=1 Tax=Desulfosarcina cetonica TaxID=90730 RepID=UPI00155D974D|nr:GNAT family N-acetyltransferase [Desulfosarcina cetonica]
MMDFSILTKPSQVVPFIISVQKFADANRKSFGFLPQSAFLDQANNGRLWVVVDKEKNECLGYLMFGGKFPTLKIFQIFIVKKYRKLKIGKALLEKFEAYAEENNFLSVNARVAADLVSNKFWHKSGYTLIKQLKGGKTTNRNINLRIKELDTPSLFKLMSFNSCVDKSGLKSLRTSQRPIYQSQTYVIDLNVFFDVVKRRVDKINANRLITAGLNNEIKIYITPEFCEELERNRKKSQDPIIEFAKQLPTLPTINDNEINKTIGELKVIVFPERENADAPFSQNRSDLTHLAYCIHHGAYGFITREKAILTVSDQLKESYSIEVLSPSDLNQPKIDGTSNNQSLIVNFKDKIITVGSFKENQREDVEKFLTSLQVKREHISEILHPGMEPSPRHRIVAKIEDKFLAFASWDSYKSLSRERKLHLFVDENSVKSEMIIDHVIEASLRDTAISIPTIITLNTGPNQPKTTATAFKRGFLSVSGDDNYKPLKELIKFVFNGLITPKNWYNFKVKFEELTDLIIPDRMPKIDEFNNTGIIIKSKIGRSSCLSLFDFETLVSPGVVLCPGRDAIIVPIRNKYAKNLFNLSHTQLDLFFSPEALLHIEKAYFRSYRNSSIFKKGKLVIFYISGYDGGLKEVIGSGRITFSEVIKVDKASLLLERQGVLSRNELIEISNRDNLIHAFTFDNYCIFQNKISFDILKSKNLISGANLITAEQLSSKQLFKIFEIGFKNGE